MTSDDPSSRDAPPAAVVNRFSPDAEARLSVPADPAPASPAARAGSERPRGFAAAAKRLMAPRDATPAPATASGGAPHRPARRRKLTPIKRFERYFSAIFKLGRTEGMAKDARKRITAGELRMDAIEGELGKFGHDIREIWERTDQIAQALDGFGALEQAIEDQSTALHDRTAELQDRIETAARSVSDRLDQQQDRTDDQIRRIETEMAATLRAAQSETALLARLFSDLTRRLDRMAGPASTQPNLPDSGPAPVALPASEGFDLFKDSFYHRLENRYRGSVEEITRRLSIYLPDMEAAYLRTGRKPAMDIGCGRGEWLSLLRDNGIDGFGVDTNPVQITAAREAGLDVREGDALRALAEMEDASLSVLTAHHLVEHLPFDAVAWIAREAMRVLAPGGVLLFETPNTRNVLVGATTFHTDPTHLKPMPEQVLSVLFDTAGFDPVEVRHLHPHDRMGEFLARPDFNDELAFLMFGPQDLAVLGTRPNKD